MPKLWQPSKIMLEVFEGMTEQNITMEIMIVWPHYAKKSASTIDKRLPVIQKVGVRNPSFGFGLRYIIFPRFPNVCSLKRDDVV
jgi:hypothetical protein